KDGKYRMDRVAPVFSQIHVSMVLRELGNGMTQMGSKHRQYVDLKPGEMTTVDLGGTGRRVVGRLTAAAGGRQAIDWTWNMGYLRLKQPEPPDPPSVLFE